jgi:hypothetical protein
MVQQLNRNRSIEELYYCFVNKTCNKPKYDCMSVCLNELENTCEHIIHHCALGAQRKHCPYSLPVTNCPVELKPIAVTAPVRKRLLRVASSRRWYQTLVSNIMPHFLSPWFEQIPNDQLAIRASSDHHGAIPQNASGVWNVHDCCTLRRKRPT